MRLSRFPSILNATRCGLHPSSLSGIFRGVTSPHFSYVRQRFVPFVRDTHRTFGEMERNDATTVPPLRFHRRNCILPWSFFTAARGGKVGPRCYPVRVVAVFVNCFDDNSASLVAAAPRKFHPSRVLGAPRDCNLCQPRMPGRLTDPCGILTTRLRPCLPCRPLTLSLYDSPSPRDEQRNTCRAIFQGGGFLIRQLDNTVRFFFFFFFFWWNRRHFYR